MPVVQVEAFDLPIDLNGISSLVLRDRRGRMFVDPLLMGMSSTEVMTVNMDPEDDPPQCHFNHALFVELEWLMPLHQPEKTVFPEECRNRAEVIKRLCFDCVATLQGRVVEVNLLEGC